MAMALTAMPGIVQGDTIEDLQVQIAALMAQINALNAQISALTGTTPTGIPSACVGITFTRNLSQGSTGADVKCLQAMLNMDPATQVAATGAGSPGAETTYFGPLTRGAVVKFQEKYRAEVLTPVGLTAGTGFVGPQTRAKLDAMMRDVPPPECTTDADCDEGYMCVNQKCVKKPVPDTCETDADCPAGYICEDEECVKEPAVTPEEGELMARWLPTPTGVNANWGESNVSVAAIELKARDSAIRVDRIDINFNAVPWQKISYLALFEGDNAIKGSPINKDTISEISFGTNYRLRLTGLGINVPKNGVKNITVKVNVPSIPRDPGTLTMTVGTDAIRGTDTANIYQYAGATGNRQFTVAATGLGARIETKINADTPKEGFVLIDSDVTTIHEVLRFDLSATRDHARVRVLTVNLDDDTNIQAVRLYDGANAIGSLEASTTVTFTNLEVDIAKDTTKTLNVKVEYADTSSPSNLVASVPAGGVIAVSHNEETPDYTGSATGHRIYFWEVVPELKLVSKSLSLIGDTTNTASGHITFSVTALGGEVFVSATSGHVAADSGAATTTDDFDTTGLTQTAAGSYRIAQGQSLTFTINGYLTNVGGTPGFKRFFLSLFTWDTVDGGTSNAWTNTNWMVEKVRTDSIHMAN